MQRSSLLLLLLMAACLWLTGFVLRDDALRGRDGAKSAMAVLFGDGRRLFANHFLTKADAYFHRGRYPSIFEMAESESRNHLVESLGDELEEPIHVHGTDCDHDVVEESHVHGPDCDHSDDDDLAYESEDQHAEESESEEEHEHDESCAHAELTEGPNDWISRLAARFEPDRHVHLEEGAEKEMLPWVQLAVEMDPHNVDAYTVGGYWLQQMGRVDEAKAFLRDGQRNNPDSFEIYFELGRLTEGEETNPQLAIRLYELSLDRWRKANEGREEPDLLAVGQILGRLGSMKEGEGDLEAALHYYTLLKTVSQSPEGVQRLINSVQEQIAGKQAGSESL